MSAFGACNFTMQICEPSKPHFPHACGTCSHVGREQVPLPSRATLHCTRAIIDFLFPLEEPGSSLPTLPLGGKIFSGAVETSRNCNGPSFRRQGSPAAIKNGPISICGCKPPPPGCGASRFYLIRRCCDVAMLRCCHDNVAMLSRQSRTGFRVAGKGDHQKNTPAK